VGSEIFNAGTKTGGQMGTEQPTVSFRICQSALKRRCKEAHLSLSAKGQPVLAFHILLSNSSPFVAQKPKSGLCGPTD